MRNRKELFPEMSDAKLDAIDRQELAFGFGKHSGLIRRLLEELRRERATRRSLVRILRKHGGGL